MKIQEINILLSDITNYINIRLELLNLYLYSDGLQPYIS